jgi:OOP family OmpA-OmpF porin
MNIFNKILITLSLFFVISCSASYENLSNNIFTPKDEFSKHLMDAYKEKADFEALEMHDWNSAKLYSEKALLAVKGEKILPQKISYWKIIPEKQSELSKAYTSLMSIYEQGLILDPFNLAKAISSLDCWSEQQEEIWQTWDINKCRDDFLNAMHEIYRLIDEDEKNKQDKISKEKKDVKTKKIVQPKKIPNNKATIVTKDKTDNILQIIYFDFDKSNLSQVSINEIKNFITDYENIIHKYLIVGHTDTAGTPDYNYELSIERAITVKKILIGIGIDDSNIKIIGMGERELSVQTNDDVAHPANRRAEISPLN